MNQDELMKLVIETARQEALKVVSELSGTRTALVTGITNEGKPVIKFDEDDLPSLKTYRALKSYVPEIGDRVLLLNNIILGGWKP